MAKSVKSFSQDLVFNNEIKTESSFFTVDNLGKIYAVRKGEIIQYSQDGKILNRYSNNGAGNISSIDASNPLKILVFFQNQEQLVFLDNTLSQQTEPIMLESFQREQASLCCSSINNGFWIFDQRELQLIRYSEKLVEVQKTVNIAQIIGKEVNPVFMIERNNWLYLSDPNLGILIFDIYGTYLKTIPIKDIKSFQVIDDFIYFNEKNSMKRFDIKENTKMEILLPKDEIKGMWINKKNLFILTPETLSTYTIKM